MGGREWEERVRTNPFPAIAPEEKFLYLNSKPLCQHGNPNQAELRIKSPGLLRKMLPDDFSAPREETGRRDQKTIWLVPGAQGKNPVGVVLGVSGGGATVWRVGGGGLRRSFHLNSGLILSPLPPSTLAQGPEPLTGGSEALGPSHASNSLLFFSYYF